MKARPVVALVLAAAVLLLVGCGLGNVRVLSPEDSEGNREVWEVENIPDSGEVVFESKKDGESEQVKIAVKKEGGGGWNPLTWIRDIVSGAIALVFNRSDVTIPVD